MCGFINVIVSENVSTPPPKALVTPLNSKTLFLLRKTGWSTASPLLPPVNWIDIISSISKFCGSTCISFISPLSTGLTNACVDAEDTDPTSITGGLIIS